MAQRDLQPNTDTTLRQPVQRPDAQIRLVFEKFQAFVDEYRSRISLGGVFVATSQPKAVGATISCEFKLADGYRLCQTLGEVLWIRPQSTAPDRPAGMGIRFRAIDDEGRKLILKILEEQVKSGGEPFEVERLPSDAGSQSAAAAPSLSPRENPASTLVRDASMPAPREHPASTHSRPAVPAAVAAVEDVRPIEGVGPAGGASAFDVVEPVEVGATEPVEVGASEPLESPSPDFNAPWGNGLPEVPEEIIEPVDEQELLATAHEVFSSDATEAGFSSDADADLFDLGEPDELPELELPDGSELGPPPEAPDFSTPEPALDFDLEAVDEPLSSDPLAAGPSQVELDDTLARQLPDDGGPGLERRPAVPEPPRPVEQGPIAAQDAAVAATGVDEPLTAEPLTADSLAPSYSALDRPETGPSFSDVDEPLTSSSLPQLSELPAAEVPDVSPPERFFGAREPESAPAASAAVEVAEHRSRGADHLIDMISQEEAWEDSDADEEWEDQEAESGLKGALHDVQLTVSESRGRIVAVVLVLVALGAGLIFRERILGLVGLGVSPVSGSPAAMAGGEPAEPEATAEAAESPPASAGGEIADAPPVSGGGAAGAPSVRGVDERRPPPPPPATLPPDPPTAAQRPEPRGGAAVPGPAASRVDDVRYAQTSHGTEVVIQLDGDLSADRYQHDLLGYDALKEQITILGIDLPFRSKVDIGTLELDRIRTGLHGDRLVLVFDLSSELMTLKNIQALGDRLQVEVSRR